MKKNKGSGLLIMAILASVITALIGISLAKVHNLSLSSLQSNKLNLQAQAYAESEIKYLNCLEFDQIKSHQKYYISNTDYKTELQVTDSTIPDKDITTKNCTVNIFYKNEPLPRISLNKTFYSTDGGKGIGEPQYIGKTDGGTLSGTAKESGFIVAAGSNKPRNLSVRVNGTLLGYVVPRGYGTGDIQVCVPCPKGATWQITGKCSWAYWMPLK